MNKILLHVKIIIAIFINVIFLINCNLSGKNDKVSILVSLPLTGDAAAYGKLLKDGVEYGLSELDSNVKNKLNVIYQDDKLSTKDAVNILHQEMAKQKLAAVMTSSTELAMNLGPICNENKVILLPPIADGDQITKAGEYVFLITPVSSFQSQELARYMTLDKVKTAAIIFLNDSWGNSLTQEFTKAFEATSGKVLIKEGFNAGTRDFRETLLKIKKGNPDALLIILHPAETIPVLKQIRELGIKSKLYGGDTFSNKELYQKEVVDLVQGIKFTLPAQPNNEIFSSFKKGFKEKYGYEADINAAAARDAIILIASTVKLGAKNGTMIKDIFMQWKNGVKGATGLITWDDNRNVISKNYSLYKINQGLYSLANPY